MSVLLAERRDDGVLLLTLNRPERLNALSRELLTALDEQCAAAREDRDVRALVVTGAGDRAFCAGADVHQLDGISPSDAFELMRFGQGVLDRLAALPQPVLAAVNGVALGGGCEVALACDVRFAAESARFAQPEILLANVPGWGGTQRLPRLIGPGRANELILSGRPVSAEEALAWGLANRVVADELLLEEALAFAGALAQHSPVALAGAKQAIAHGLEHGQAAGLFVEAEAVARCCETEEQRAAVRAFLARRSKAS
jgi:enoyl-CoA hydratase/carnithine racemase